MQEMAPLVRNLEAVCRLGSGDLVKALRLLNLGLLGASL